MQRLIISIIIALLGGFITLMTLYSDLGPEESIAVRLYYVEGVYLLTGIIVGIVTPAKWWLAGITAWSGVALAAIALITPDQSVMLAPIFLVVSLLPSFLGGYIGAEIAKRRLLTRLFRRR